MSTPATTISAIREQQQTLIEAITPAQHSGVKFREHRSTEQFDEWAEKNPASCFRRYEVRNVTAGDVPEISNLDIVQEYGELQYLFAYPNRLGKYGIDGRRDLDDMIDEDRISICNTIGVHGYSSYTAGQHNSICSWTVTEGDAVTFLEIAASVLYYRSAQ